MGLLLALTREIPVEVRQGTFQLPTIDVPLTTARTLTVRPAMSILDIPNPALSFVMRLQWLDGAVWKDLATAGWIGGGDPLDPDFQFPSLTVGLTAVAGKTVRGELEIPVAMTTGWAAEMD